MRVDQLLNDRSIPYTSQGRDYLVKCLNPEHEDSSPSLRIDKLTGKMGCFSCGFGGDVFKFFNEDSDIQHIRALTLLNKIEELRFKPLNLPYDAKPFTTNFKTISTDTYKAFGAFRSDQYKGLEDAVIFPITDIMNDIQFFHGRKLFTNTAKDKYINQPSGSNKFPFPAIIKPIKGTCILVEGFFDMLNMVDKYPAFTNVVTTFGVGFGAAKKDHKNEKALAQLAAYKNFGVHTFYVLYDGDDAGKLGADRLVRNIKKTGMEADSVELGDGEDPGGFSAEQLAQLYELLYEDKK